MKKVFLSALAICGIVAANAQTSNVAPATPTHVTSATSTASVTLSLYDRIEILPSIDDYSQSFSTVNDYIQGRTLLAGGGPADYNDYFVRSNRNFKVTIKATDFSVTGATDDNVNMPASIMGYRLYRNDVFGSTQPSVESNPSLAYTTMATNEQDVVSGAATGANPGQRANFKLQLKANPGWNYAGGVYTSTVTLTATQQ